MALYTLIMDLKKRSESKALSIVYLLVASERKCFEEDRNQKRIRKNFPENDLCSRQEDNKIIDKKSNGNS